MLSFHCFWFRWTPSIMLCPLSSSLTSAFHHLSLLVIPNKYLTNGICASSSLDLSRVLNIQASLEYLLVHLLSLLSFSILFSASAFINATDTLDNKKLKLETCFIAFPSFTIFVFTDYYPAQVVILLISILNVCITLFRLVTDLCSNSSSSPANKIWSLANQFCYLYKYLWVCRFPYLQSFIEI